MVRSHRRLLYAAMVVMAFLVFAVSGRAVAGQAAGVQSEATFYVH